MPITKVPARVRTELARGAPTYAIRPLAWHKRMGGAGIGALQTPEQWRAVIGKLRAYVIHHDDADPAAPWVLSTSPNVNAIAGRSELWRLSSHPTADAAKRAAAKHWREDIAPALVPVHP